MFSIKSGQYEVKGILATGQEESKKMSEGLHIKEIITSLEEKLLNPVTRKSVEEVSQLLADDYLEFSSSEKIYSQKDALEVLQMEPAQKISAYDFNVNLLVPVVALITYIAVKKINQTQRQNPYEVLSGKRQEEIGKSYFIRKQNSKMKRKRRNHASKVLQNETELRVNNLYLCEGCL